MVSRKHALPFATTRPLAGAREARVDLIVITNSDSRAWKRLCDRFGEAGLTRPVEYFTLGERGVTAFLADGSYARLEWLPIAEWAPLPTVDTDATVMHSTSPLARGVNGQNG